MQATQASRTMGFDTSIYVDQKYYDKLKSAGYGFVVRYLWRTKRVDDKPNYGWPVALSKQELSELLYAGFGVSIVQFSPDKGVIPTAVIGKSVGEAAASNAAGLGIPKGVTIWCDAEWSNDPPAEDVIDYLNAWASPVVNAGYEAGLYLGGGTGMTGEQLYDLPEYNHYWKSASAVPWVPKRGFQMFQTNQTTVFKAMGDVGLTIDQDLVCIDNKGERFKLVTK